MNTPIAVRIECAKGEILNAMETIQKKTCIASVHHGRSFVLRTGRGKE